MREKNPGENLPIDILIIYFILYTNKFFLNKSLRNIIYMTHGQNT